MASFHDDLMIPVRGDACNLVDLTMKATTTALYVFNMFGLSLNFSANKTEAIITFNGAGANNARCKLSKAGCSANFQNLNNVQCTLNFVKCCKHLGTKTSVSCDMAEEVVMRTCAMSTDAKRLKKRVFNNSSVAISGAISVAKTYLFSKSCFQCGTWPNLNARVYHKFHSAVMHIYRMATKQVIKGPTNNLSDSQLLVQYKLPGPANIIKLARVSVFVRLIQKQIAALIPIVINMSLLPSGWAHDVVKDLKWMALSEEFADLLHMDCTAIIAHIGLAPKEFLLKVRKFYLPEFQNIDVHCTSSAKVGNGNIGRHECYECGIVQPTYQQLQLHIKTIHKVSNPIALYIETTHCHICLTEFHTRE